MDLYSSSLGKITSYKTTYDPELLFIIPRADQRKEFGFDEKNPVFFGVDIWNAYELSWLNEKGKPCVTVGEFYISAESPYMVESKSFKLYLNSYNNTKFSSMDEVQRTILHDLSDATSSAVQGKLFSLNEKKEIKEPTGKNIDALDIECYIYDTPDKSLIEYEDAYVKEEIYSNLLKSNCLITGQPDWGTLIIKYEGQKLVHESILRYIVSFRGHNEFHEHCVERIFMDIKSAINPEHLSVYARYTRRGGLDISPYRSTSDTYELPSNDRLIRQ